jgi:hypothetical protein
MRFELHDLRTRGRTLKFKFWRTVSLGNKNKMKECQLAEKLKVPSLVLAN